MIKLTGHLTVLDFPFRLKSVAVLCRVRQGLCCVVCVRGCVVTVCVRWAVLWPCASVRLCCGRVRQGLCCGRVRQVAGQK